MNTSDDASKNDGASVCLVLGRGSARGLANIGIVNWLEEAGIVIESVPEASMGALVGESKPLASSTLTRIFF